MTVWAAESGKVSGTLKVDGHSVRYMAVSADGKVVVLSFKGGTVRVWP